MKRSTTAILTRRHLHEHSRRVGARHGSRASIAFVFLALALTHGIGSPASAQSTASLDQQAARAALIYQLAQNPRSLAIAQTRAAGIRSGLTDTQVTSLVDRYTDLYDEQVLIDQSGEVPFDVGDRTVIELGKLAFQQAVSTVVPGASGVSREILDAGLQLFTDTLSADVVSRSGEILAERQYQSVVNVERITDYILGTPGMRDSLIQDVGVDIEATFDQQTAQHPEVGNVFLSRQILTGIQVGGRQLADLAASIAQLDANDARRAEDLKGEVVAALGEGLSLLNSEIGSDITEIAANQVAIHDQILERSLVVAGEVGRNRQILTTFIANQLQRQAAQDAAQMEARDEAQRQAHLRSYLQAGAFLLDQIEPGLGKKVSTIANSTIQIAGAISEFSKHQSLDLASVASLTSGVANPAIAIFAVMQATGPSVDQQILGQLAAIAQQIETLRRQMNDRFDIVDDKLDRLANMMIQVQAGLNDVARGVEVNLEAIVHNLQIGLDTQSLLVGLSENLFDYLIQGVLTDCLDSSAPYIEDSHYVQCVNRLRDFASSAVASNQIPWYSTLEDETLTLSLSPDFDQQNVDVLRREFESRSGQLLQDPSDLYSVAEWRMAANWYQDFLLSDREQFDRTRVNPDIDRVIRMGSRIEGFRDLVVDSFDPAENGQYKIVDDLLGSGRHAVEQMSQLIEDEIAQFQEDRALNLGDLSMSFDDLPVDGPGIVYWNADARNRRRTDPQSAQAVFDALPEVVRAAALAGLGRIEGDLYWYNTEYSRQGFSGFRIYWHEYRLRVYFVFHENLAHPSASGRHKVAEIRRARDWRNRWIFYVDEPNADRAGPTRNYILSSVPPREVLGCANVNKCIGRAVRKNLRHLVLSDVPENHIRQAWEAERLAVANRILSRLRDTARHNWDWVDFENAYFGALVRFAFRNGLASSDALLGFSTGNLGLPRPADFANRIEELRSEQGDAVALPIVFKSAEYLADEVAALKEYFESEDLPQQISRGRANVDVDYTIEELKQTDAILLPEPTFLSGLAAGVLMLWTCCRLRRVRT